ncbi:MAG: type I-F CRISPR-associated protein Csy2 [Acidithiobacillus ferriphilus]|jgi:CRISPR-associated protein Csy2|uniref:type I-F CRISPR-associated protein Csy2 n=1 Tax=Acidithiobacillus ferriphilus TaxID=1689834 RepID=UPI00242EDDA7|nr:type I-F CRISPR-associated protein Csy2 [Acidithiobacillus ferriphilus]MBW9247732.1 type I-F CRISPR-associated protein Csy2 [Acidithiobacillus ferriphilus]MBW9253779.1 type I-F CRISPR-associated protein Csy2 [Acidithiobacillus ferriphilus]
MSSEHGVPEHPAVLALPHIRVQNANAISSPMTWGFPAITAFTGLMSALERRLGRDAGIAFFGVGVICHGFEAQVTTSGYTRAFHLTRNPVLADGSTAGIVEEGRVHLDVTLVFDVQLTDANRGDAERAALAERVAYQLAGMRLAGGSVMPALPGPVRRPTQPVLELVPDESQDDERRKQFRRLARRWLPGFALVSRDDLLQARLAELRTNDPATTALDAWLDLSRWNTRAVGRPPKAGTDAPPTVEWVRDPRVGWTVPIPVGFAALSDLYVPGTVSGTRDMGTPFRFVETVWSMGQWISPHRLRNLKDLVWSPCHDPEHPSEHGLYRCRNAYTPALPTTNLTDSSTPN